MGRKSSRKLWGEFVARGGRAGVSVRVSAPVTGRAFQGVVLGIDPSLRGTGWAVLDYGSGGTARLLGSGTLKLRAALPMAECLGAIGNRVAECLDGHPVRHLAIEQTIYVQNFQTAQILGAARGAAIAAAAMRGLPVFEYAPLRIKQAVVGAGRASKVQVARTLEHLLTGAAFEERYDESDAAAVALCHAFTWRAPV